MSHSFAFTERLAIGGTVVDTEINTVTAGERISIDDSVPIANDQLFALSVDVSQVKGVFIVSDQNLLLETNSSTSPAQTLSLIADIPYIWYTSKYDTLKFTTDITALYITNASAAAANFYLEILTDPTI